MSDILQIVYDLNCGGVEAFVTNLNSCSDIFKQPFDFILFTSDEKEQFFESKNRELGSNIIKIVDSHYGTQKFKYLRKRFALYRIIKKNKYRVVHIHKESAICIVEAVVAKIAGAKCVIVHSHNTQNVHQDLRGKVENFLQRVLQHFWPFVADYLCACSTEAGQWLFGKSEIEKGNVRILKNGIKGSDYYFSPQIRELYRKRLQWENYKIIGHVGRFSEQKNHSFIIDIFSEAYRKDKNVRLILFGTGELENQVREKVGDLGLTKEVCFAGTSPEINRWLQAMDLFLFPSLYEGLPIAGIEAQAAGVPILASDTISSELKITDKIQWMSLTCPAFEWAETALRLIYEESDRDTANEIRGAGYDIVCTAEQINQLYRKSVRE